jgi:hypothetical protein
MLEISITWWLVTVGLIVGLLAFICCLPRSAPQERATSASCRLAKPSTISSFMPLPCPLCRIHPRHLAGPGRSAG